MKKLRPQRVIIDGTIFVSSVSYITGNFWLYSGWWMRSTAIGPRFNDSV